jgi:putative ABC transport system permease protein
MRHARCGGCVSGCADAGGVLVCSSRVKRQHAQKSVAQPQRHTYCISHTQPLNGEHVMQLLSHLFRRWRQKPGLAGFSIASLSVGLAATAAIFSVLQNVVLAPLPFPDSGQLLRIYEQAPNGNTMAFGAPNAVDVAQRQSTFSAVAGFQEFDAGVRSGATTITARIYKVQPEYFSVLGIKPAQGRSFTTNALGVALVNQAAWQALFCGNAACEANSASNREFGSFSATLESVGSQAEVIGILPQSASLVAGPAVYFPLAGALGSRTGHNLDMIGRLKPGVSLAAAQAQLADIAQQILREQGSGVDLATIAAKPWLSDILGPAAGALWLILAAASLLLFIGCANVLNLFLSELLLRRREFAVQAALGATPAALRRGPLLELAAITVLSSLLAWPLAGFAVRALANWLGDSLPRGHLIALSNVTLIALALTSAACLALVSCAIALWLQRARLEQYSAAQERSQSLSRVQLLVQKSFLALQTAFLVTLLLGALAVGRSVDALLAEPLGFAANSVISAELTLPEALNAPIDFEKPITASLLTAPVAAANTEFRRYLDALRTLPGVEAVGLTNALPLSGNGANGSYVVETLPASAEPAYDMQGLMARYEGATKAQLADAQFRQADAGYFAAMGIALRRGRLFDSSDVASGAQVALISEAAAVKNFAGRDPIGQRVQFGNMDGDTRLMTIVGIVADVRDSSLGQAMPAILYANTAQRRLSASSVSLVVRTAPSLSAGATATLMQSMRRALQNAAPGQPVAIKALSATVRDALGVRDASGKLFLAFAGAAFLLGALGLFALTRFVLSQQSRSLCVRAALGASSGQIMGGVYREWLLVQSVGLVLGLIAASVALRGLKSQLYGVTLFEPSSVALICTAILVLTISASTSPVRRAARADAGTLLR